MLAKLGFTRTTRLLLFLALFMIINAGVTGADNKNVPASPPPKKGIKNHDFLKHSTLAGVIKRSMKKMLLTPEKTKLIGQGLVKVVNIDELLFFVLLGWLAVPALKFQYITWGDDKVEKRPFEETYLHLFFDNISQLAKIALLIYMVDIFKVIRQGMGFSSLTENMPHAFAKICYTAWVANRIAALKRWLLARHTHKTPQTLDGQVQIVDRLVDAAIYGLALYVAVDTVQTDMGAATKSFVAFGSVSTLVVSLAMQGFVAELLHGLFLAGSNRINEGDNVELLGMKGKIEDLGWLESTLRRSDNILVSIPNKDLAGQRISNLSRVKTSQVKQTLRFKYDDYAFEKLPNLLADIRREVARACPYLITDGSRPFRLHMTNFHGDHIEVVCDLHFRIRPVGDMYWDNRQQVLMAIGRAVKRSQLEFQMVPEL